MRGYVVALAIAANLAAGPAASAAAKPLTRDEKVVVAFLDAMDKMAENSAVEDVPRIVQTFWTADCVQHRVGVAPGPAGLIASLSKLPTDPKSREEHKNGPKMETVSLVSDKGRVTIIRRRIAPDPANPGKMAERYVFNVYRLESGKIAENWWSISS